MTKLEIIKENIVRLKSAEANDITKFAVVVIDYLSYIEAFDVIELAEDLYAYSAANADKKPLLFCYANLINTFGYLFDEKFEKALTLIVEVESLFSEQNDSIGSAICKGVHGTLYRTIGNYDMALACLMIAQEHLKVHKTTQIRLMACLNDIGGIYLDLKNYEESLSVFNEMELISRVNNNFYWTVYANQGIGKVNQNLNRYELAEKYLFKALQVSEINNHKKSICNSYNALANYFSAISDYTKAIDFNKQALLLRESMNLISGAITNCISLGGIYIKLQRQDEAIEILTKGLELANKISVKKKKYQIHFMLSELFESRGELKKAILHYKYFHETQFELEVEDSNRKISNAKIIFQSEQNKKENIIIKKQKELLEKEKENSDFLLFNILPKEIALELKENGTAAAKLIDYTTIMFTDFKGFTQIAEKMSPVELVNEINVCFKAFDNITTKHNIEKIKTIGDSYMCAGGLPVANKTHAIDVVNAGLEIQEFMHEHNIERKKQGKVVFEIRIGIHTGPVVAGVVGFKKFAYDIWGDTVNIASRIESSGVAGKVNISESTYHYIKEHFHCKSRGKISAKNKGEIHMHFVESKR